MKDWLYITPNNLYAISKARNNRLWIDIFGEKEQYYICKYSEKYSRYYIFRSEDTIENCLIWFRDNRIISGDEMEYQNQMLYGRKSK